ncbi:putative multiple sugar transport system ATP-binding protein [Mobilisporobacter senegalensis]|uniref:Putative multiple sugar transport system ATP-binding protein n=1 Tax=Mobilisporobacter senegalensis TaxID=1329262 RepID=A0A3N1Y2W2_9FIRM|nr:ATP-binding cassette domain-containing protein [Mobilisporobacter senegalensis]ROR31892.1 putative multiple sugar transport system ATP-binding protein [Mobilisporobacter senegalensis]
MSEYILEMKNISKTFPGVKALSNVNFKVKTGEIHCLVGENGAGKSTLMKVLSGVYPYGTYEGNIILNEEEQKYKGIADSEAAGVAIIYQELALIPELSLYENIYFGHEIKKGMTVDWNETIVKASEMLKQVRLDVNPATKVKDLSVGKQQLVEIAKALSKNVKLLILDEPTAALNEDDSANLLDLLRELKTQGVTSIMISHKLKEIVSIADTVTVLRDGQTVCSMDAIETKVTEQDIIKHMVGREINNIYPKRENVKIGNVCFEVKNLTAYDPTLGREILHNVNLNVRKGEIIGIAGLMGAGRTEFALSVFGNPKGYKVDGEILVNGENKVFHSPKDAIGAGIAYVTEDRKGNGLILIDDIKHNITIANINALAKSSVINENEEINVANRYLESINIKAPSIEQCVGNLSGGNQQKVSIAKWLFAGPDLLILDEPTRGIDVGAKFEIYSLMNKLVEQGMSIIMISSELLEVLGMSDRVYVMSNGKITGEVAADEATEQGIMAMATTI